MKKAHCSRALGFSIFIEAQTVDESRTNVREAVLSPVFRQMADIPRGQATKGWYFYDWSQSKVLPVKVMNYHQDEHQLPGVFTTADCQDTNGTRLAVRPK